MNAFQSSDLAIHLCGGQPLPVLMATRLIHSHQHVFFVTKESKEQFENIRPLVEKNGWSAEAIETESDDPNLTHSQILDLIQEKGAKDPMINCTGGTKLMYTGALEVMFSNKASGMYINSSKRQVHIMKSGKWELPMELPPLIDDLEEFFQVSGAEIRKSGHIEENPMPAKRVSLTNFLWNNKQLVNGMAKVLVSAKANNPKAGKPGTHEYTNKRGKSIKVILEKDGKVKLQVNNKNFQYKDMKDIYIYLSGTWLEEYTSHLLKPLLDKGKILDLRMGLETDFQEIDVCYTDGYELFIVECKSGGISQEQIQKLENLIRRYAGVTARGILASCFDSNVKQQERINRSNPPIAWYHGDLIKGKLPLTATNPAKSGI